MRISDWSSDVCSSDLVCQLSWMWSLNRLSHSRVCARCMSWRKQRMVTKNGAIRPVDRELGVQSSFGLRFNYSGASAAPLPALPSVRRSEQHTSELQSLMRISYAVFCLKKQKTTRDTS